MEASGYDQRLRRDILESGIVGYKRKGGIRHRKGNDTKKERMSKKLCGKTNWYKKKSKTLKQTHKLNTKRDREGANNKSKMKNNQNTDKKKN